MSNAEDITDANERPLRVLLFGEQFAAVNDAEACGFSASGPNAVATLASRLLQAGFDPDRTLVMFRASEQIGRTSIAAAAQTTGE